MQALDNRRIVLERWTDADIAAVYLGAALHERPVLWVCQAQNWPAFGPTPASQSTMSRRLRTAEVLPLFYQVLQYLRSLLQPDGWVRIVERTFGWLNRLSSPEQALRTFCPRGAKR